MIHKIWIWDMLRTKIYSWFIYFIFYFLPYNLKPTINDFWSFLNFDRDLRCNHWTQWLSLDHDSKSWTDLENWLRLIEQNDLCAVWRFLHDDMNNKIVTARRFDGFSRRCAWRGPENYQYLNKSYLWLRKQK